ncbi:ParA family protein [Dactylosporangium sp. NBC_01737]|uniref:ParA family protein n=1 Tax=Dactylosporangium sp. NBC_01737 TaxID=2975959 RepID=UPI002E1530E5|nr:ParA family protein [Dactylosporangium sp. NBC_01737]
MINYKGGVGKTTLTANLGAELARRGQNVLLIDLDPQSSLTFCFYQPDEWRLELREGLTIKRWFDSIDDGVPKVALADLVVQPRPVNAALLDGGGQVSLIASHLQLIDADFRLARSIGGIEQKFDPALYRVRCALATALHDESFEKYDWILIDCPPNFNVVTQAAIVASDHIVIPAKADYLSTLGIEYLYGNVEELVQRHNEHSLKHAKMRHSRIDPNMAGVVFTMIQFHGGRPISALQYYIDQVRALGVPVFSTYMRENNTLFASSVPRGVPAVLRERVTSQINIELRTLASEFLNTLHAEGAAA